MPGSPYYKLAEKITEWLSFIPESKINFSSKQTVDNLRNISLDHDEVVISFDVTSLYTNVPVKEAIFEAAQKLYSGKFAMTQVNKEAFTILAELATANIVMLTNDGPYCQIDGLAMGSHNQRHHYQTFGYQNLSPIFKMMLNVLKDTWMTILGPLNNSL